MVLLTYTNGLMTKNPSTQFNLIRTSPPNTTSRSQAGVAIRPNSVTVRPLHWFTAQNQPHSPPSTSNVTRKSSTSPLVAVPLTRIDPSSPLKYLLLEKATGYKNPFDYSQFARSAKLASDIKTDGEKQESPPSQFSMWKCLICGKEEQNKDALIDHYEYHKKEKDKLKNRTIEQTDQISDIDEHDGLSQSEDVQSYGCQTCKATFATEKALSKHMCHRETLERLCFVCGKTFKNEIRLKFHLKVHSGAKNYVCTVCGKSFRQSYTFKCHTRVHSGEKPYKCTTCGKCFSQKTPLVIHQRSHTGERPYTCGKCGKGHVSRNAVNIHSRHCR